MTSSTAPTTATRHPLAPLTADEVKAAGEILSDSHRIPDGSRFVSVSLQEPPKEEVLAWDGAGRRDREAFVVVYDRAGRQVYEAVVSLTREDVVRCEAIPGARPSYLLEEVFAVPGAVMADSRWQEAMRRRGITDLSLAHIDPWPGAWLSETDCLHRGDEVVCYDDVEIRQAHRGQARFHRREAAGRDAPGHLVADGHGASVGRGADIRGRVAGGGRVRRIRHRWRSTAPSLHGNSEASTQKRVHMRRILAFTLMGIDGAVEDPRLLFPPSDVPDEPFFFDDESDAFERAATTTQDAVLLGRNQWEEWRSFWPGVSGPFADFINGVDKYVLTSRPLDAEWTGSVAVKGSLETVVGDLMAKPGRDVGVHGSIQLVQSLIEADLLDELRIIATPVAGTPGRRLFENLKAPKRYRLASAAATSTGNLLLTYERPRAPGPGAS